MYNKYVDNPQTQPGQEQPIQPQPPVTPEVQTQEAPPPEPKKTSGALKVAAIVLFVLLVTGGLALAAYRLGQQSAPTTPVPTATPQITPSPTPVEIDYEGIPITENTVSFAQVGSDIYLRYRGKIYTEQEEGEVEPATVTVPEANYTWYGLVEAPEGLTENEEFNRVFSFKQTSGTSFLFVMRWGTDSSQSFSTFNFAGNEVKTLSFDTSEGYSVPKIAQISTDGNYAAIDLYGCWNCGGHEPETGANENIGRVLNFAWGENGNYTYKEYIAKECEPPAEGPVQCSEDPNTLPQKSGNI